jgi:Fe-S cluster assembly protein SufD
MSLTTTDKNLTNQIITLLEQKLGNNADLSRKEAFESFQKTGLPGAKHEEYKHTPITRELEKVFSFSGLTPAVSDLNVSEFFIPELDANVLVFVNGVFSKSISRILSPSSEITVSDLRTALDSDPIAREHFSKYITANADAFASWNTAGWDEGVFIHIPNNAVVDKPVILHYINDARAGEVLAVNRNLIVSGRSSEVTIIEKFDSLPEGNHFMNLVTEIVVAENAGLNFYSVQNDAGNRYQYSLTEIHQKNASRVNTYTFTLNGKVIRNNLKLVIDGEGIESHMYGLYLLGGQTIGDNHTVVDHRKPNSFSNEMYKGIMDDSSKGVFNGKIFVRPQAQKTNAFQANRNILLTNKASVNTKPQLEIWADDVKCSHGCTSGQLDEEALFYLRTRGINKDTAQAMVLYAFAAEVVDNVKNPVLKAFVDSVISERLHKNF